MNRYSIVAAIVATAFGAAPSRALTGIGDAPATVSRLAAYGKVWGFLKYYHPGVATGKPDWDSVLVAEWPRARAAAAGSKAEFTAAVARLLDAAGPVPRCATCSVKRYTLTERKLLDLRWIDAKTFSPAVVTRLHDVRDNRNQGQNVYAKQDESGMIDFSAERPYSDKVFPDEPWRALSAFRYWNIIHYLFPYKDVIGEDWNAVLLRSLPAILSATDTVGYQRALYEMTTHIRDTHGKLTYVPGLWRRLYGTYNAPFAGNLGFVHGKLVAMPNRILDSLGFANGTLPGVFPGDVITRIDGVPVERLRAERGWYVHASNRAALDQQMPWMLFTSTRDSATLTVRRGGQTLTRRVALTREPVSNRPRQMPWETVVRVLPGNVGYVDLGQLTEEQVPAMWEVVRGARAIVFDLRSYPRWAWAPIMQRLNPRRVPMTRITKPDLTYPGMFRGRRVGPPPSAGGQRGGRCRGGWRRRPRPPRREAQTFPRPGVTSCTATFQPRATSQRAVKSITAPSSRVNDWMASSSAASATTSSGIPPS